MLFSKLHISTLLFILAVVFCSAAEILLLEVKYNMFTGGFLQYNQLKSYGERSLFIALFMVFNVIFYGAIYLFWKFIFSKTKMKNTVIAFHFFMIAGITTAISLVVQFELHKYFADAMDLALMKNLAGGDLKTAILYAMDEAFLFIIGFFVLIVVYYILYRLAKGFLHKHGVANDKKSKKISVFKIAIFTVSSMVFLAISMTLINKNNHIYFNLMRANSYSVMANTMDFISDVDRDGYGSFTRPTDSHVFNDNISPGALDILGNGIDEDGYFGDFTEYSPIVNYKIKGAKAGKPKHIITIVMESTRADVIGKMVDDELVAPHMTALAKEGQLIKEAFSHTGYTATSLASIFSGSIGAFTKDKSLFQILNKQGYGIAVFSGQDETWGNNDIKLGTREVTSKFYDARAGVELRVFPSKLSSGLKISEETLFNEFKKYSDHVNWDKPQFIYFNMQAGHFPYYHKNMVKKFIKKGIGRSEIKAENKEWIMRTYWNSMYYADIYIGKIIAELKERNLWDDTLLIITGDHGEELFDDNHLGHGFFMSEVQTRVPLVISKKDFKVALPMGHSDVKNLILSYMFDIEGGIHPLKSDPSKSIFQMVGDLKNPAKISLRYIGMKQIMFDRRNLLVRPIGENEWISYEEAVDDPDIRVDLKKLITHWENLRWQDHLQAKIQ